MLYNDIFIFVKVFECQSYSVAAKQLNMSPPSVKRHVQTLEKALGKVLVYSGENSIGITEFGNKVYDYFKNKNHEFQLLLSLLSEEDSEVDGELRVTLPINLSARLITPFIPKFLQSHPRLILKLNHKINEPDIFSSGYDIALSMTLPAQQSLIVRNVFTSSSALYCTQAYAKKYGVPQNFSDLNPNQVISFLDPVDPRRTLPLNFIHKPSGEIFSSPNVSRLALNNISNLLALLYSNEFIIGMENYEYLFHQDKDLVRVLPEYYVEQKYYLILSSKLKDSKTKAFCDFIELCIQSFKNDPQQLLAQLKNY